MVRNREIETEQADDGADQPFGLAQSQTEHSFEGQGRRDRQIRVVRLATRRGARLPLPGRNRRLREPDRQAPALAQGSIVLGPVRDLVLLLGNVVAAVLVQLERQGRLPGIRGGAHLIRHPAPATNQPIRETRLQSAARGTNAVLHPWLRERLSAILAELPPPAPSQDPAATPA